MTHRVLIPAMVATVASVAACGDDGDDTAAACDAFVAIDRELSINEDLDAGVAAIEEFVASAPDDVAREVEPLLTLLRDDPEAAFASSSSRRPRRTSTRSATAPTPASSWMR